MYYIGNIPVVESDIKHFGIPGMKWGQRRFQNTDGTYTQAGLARYFGGGGGRFAKASGRGFGVRSNPTRGITPAKGRAARAGLGSRGLKKAKTVGLADKVAIGATLAGRKAGHLATRANAEVRFRALQAGRKINAGMNPLRTAYARGGVKGVATGIGNIAKYNAKRAGAAIAGNAKRAGAAITGNAKRAGAAIAGGANAAKAAAAGGAALVARKAGHLATRANAEGRFIGLRVARGMKPINRAYELGGVKGVAKGIGNIAKYNAKKAGAAIAGGAAAVGGTLAKGARPLKRAYELGGAKGVATGIGNIAKYNAKRAGAAIGGTLSRGARPLKRAYELGGVKGVAKGIGDIAKYNAKRAGKAIRTGAGAVGRYVMAHPGVTAGAIAGTAALGAGIYAANRYLKNRKGKNKRRR